MTFVADAKTHFTGHYRSALSGSPDQNSLPKLSFSIEFARARSSL